MLHSRRSKRVGARTHLCQLGRSLLKCIDARSERLPQEDLRLASRTMRRLQLLIKPILDLGTARGRGAECERTHHTPLSCSEGGGPTAVRLIAPSCTHTSLRSCSTSAQTSAHNWQG
jgi:hypothetical protein